MALHSTAKWYAFFSQRRTKLASTRAPFGRPLRVGSTSTATALSGDTSTRPWLKRRSIPDWLGTSRYGGMSADSGHVRLRIHSYYSVYSLIRIYDIIGMYTGKSRLAGQPRLTSTRPTSWRCSRRPGATAAIRSTGALPGNRRPEATFCRSSAARHISSTPPKPPADRCHGNDPPRFSGTGVEFRSFVSTGSTVVTDKDEISRPRVWGRMRLRITKGGARYAKDFRADSGRSRQSGISSAFYAG